MTKDTQQDFFGALEGYYLVSILEGLQRAGVLIELRAGRPVDEVAQELGFDSVMLRAVVVYVQKRCCGVLLDNGAGFTLSETSSDLLDAPFLNHLLDQYVGAFGPCLTDFEQVLADRAVGARRVNWGRHALAFSGSDRGATNDLPLTLLAQLGIERVVDIGCGGGGLLLDFAAQCPSARAWGIDSNPAAVATARHASAAAGLADRIMFCEGDAFDVATLLGSEALEGAQAIAAFNVANAFFGDSESRGISVWLHKLRQAFPDRFLLLGDYYGRLNRDRDGASHRYRRALLHDVVQVLTGQGVPPADIDAWRQIFASAGCTLVKAFEGEHDEVAHFVYLVQL